MLSALYGAAIAYYLNNDETEVVLSSGKTAWLVMAALASTHNGFSLISADIPEPANFDTDGTKSILWSPKFTRSAHVVLFAGIEIILRLASDELPTNLLATLRWIYLFTPLLFWFGLLSAPAASVLWFLEKVNIHLVGMRTNSTNLRILLSSAIAAILATLLVLVHDSSASLNLKLIITMAAGVLLSYSGSLFHTFALSTSTRLKTSPVYALLQEGVFNNSKPK